jgi:hypothetical protein
MASASMEVEETLYAIGLLFTQVMAPNGMCFAIALKDGWHVELSWLRLMGGRRETEGGCGFWRIKNTRFLKVIEMKKLTS